MKRWISLPLKDTAVLNTRLDIVEYLIGHPDVEGGDGVAHPRSG
jgi:DNA mismatch repair ATPase MutS